MSEQNKGDKLLNLRNHLEFIKTSNIPTKKKHQRSHQLIVAEALSYLRELDEVENILDEIYVDNYTITKNSQFDELVSQHKHIFYHFGKYMKFAEIIVATKHHFFISYTPISELWNDMNLAR